MNHDTVIIGGTGVGETLAGELADGEEVAFLCEDERAVERAEAAGVDARVINPKWGPSLDSEGVDGAGIVITALDEDRRNFLVAQLVRTRQVGRVIALVNDPENVEVFDDAGVEPVCVSTTLASALDRKRRAKEVGEAVGDSANHQDSTNDTERLRSDGDGGER